MLEAMDKHLPDDMHWTHPEGGMFVWATLPKGIDAVEFYKKAADAGVAVVPGEPFYEAKRGLGTFSKTVSPGLRIGWIVCSIKELMQKMTEYKHIL